MLAFYAVFGFSSIASELLVKDDIALTEYSNRFKQTHGIQRCGTDNKNKYT